MLNNVSNLFRQLKIYFKCQQTGLPSQCRYPSVFVTPFRYFKLLVHAVPLLDILVEKDLLILLEMAKYFEMLSRFRNIKQNHFISLFTNIEQCYMMFLMCDQLYKITLVKYKNKLSWECHTRRYKLS